ncbi:MAG TPA: potassium-transporting ATPase subunit F [Bacteroidales bacterium]|nr:potassium-transporting ATPase subunit F [Bacteroidales bacterium]
MNVTIFLAASQPQNMDISLGYILGAILALLILVYLLYTLVKPEKF